MRTPFFTYQAQLNHLPQPETRSKKDFSDQLNICADILVIRPDALKHNRFVFIHFPGDFSI